MYMEKNKMVKTVKSFWCNMGDIIAVTFPCWCESKPRIVVSHKGAVRLPSQTKTNLQHQGHCFHGFLFS